MELFLVIHQHVKETKVNPFINLTKEKADFNASDKHLNYTFDQMEHFILVNQWKILDYYN